MEILFTIGKAVLIMFVVTSLIVLPLISERRNYGFVWQVWKRFRVKMFFEVVGIFLLTIMLIVTLWKIPGLKYGWFNLFSDGGGNILFKPIMEGSESTSISIRMLVSLFFLALMPTMAFIVKAEEEIFRKGYNKWSSIIKQSIKFGLIHCLVGIPLAAAIALIVVGLFYGYKYKRAFDYNIAIFNCGRAEYEAVMVSITYHTMYNMVLIAIILAATIVLI